MVDEVDVSTAETANAVTVNTDADPNGESLKEEAPSQGAWEGVLGKTVAMSDDTANAAGSALKSGWNGMFSKTKSLSEKAAKKRKEAIAAAQELQEHQEQHENTPDGPEKEAAKEKMEEKEKLADVLADEAAQHGMAAAAEKQDQKKAKSTMEKLFGIVTCGCLTDPPQKAHSAISDTSPVSS